MATRGPLQGVVKEASEMNTGERIILVTGATGKQGGAVARHLVKEGWRVRALTRNPDGNSSRELRIRGAEVVQGDLNEETALREALEGVYGVYAVQTFMEQGVQVETRQGVRLASMATDEGVQHFVYSSVAHAHRNTGIPHFESKWKVEEHIRSIGTPATVIRPAFFMENFTTLPEWKSGIREGLLAMPLRPDTRLPMVSVDDIGAVVSLAFGNREAYLGRALELAGDELTGPQIAEVFSRLLCKRVIYKETPLGDVRKHSEDLALMYEWFNRTGLSVDIGRARGIYPGLKTFETWAREAIGSLITV